MNKKKAKLLTSCGRWKGQGLIPGTQTIRCVQCDGDHCYFRDYLVLPGGRRSRRKRKRLGRQSPKGVKYPRVRSFVEYSSAIIGVAKSGFPDRRSDYVPSLMGYMKEFSYTPIAGCDVLNIRIWQTPDSVPMLRTYYTDGYFLTAAKVAEEAMQELLSRYTATSYEDAVLPKQLPWVYAEPSRLKAMVAMKPSLTTGISILNFLYELKDFKSWFSGKAFTECFTELSSLFSGKGAGRTLNDIANLVSRGHLELSFNIFPLINDIGKILTLLGTFQDKTRAFIDKADEIELRRHFRSCITDLGDELVNDLSFDLRVSGAILRLTAHLEPFPEGVTTVGVNQWSYHATMDYNYSVRKLVDWNNQFLGFLQQFGVTADPSIIWNAVPFSFVADWFGNISKWLHANYSEDVMSSELYVHSYLESHRLKLRYDVSSVVSFAHGAFIAPGIIPFTGLMYASIYRRGPTEPPDPESYRRLDVDKGLTAPRVALSASLLKQIAFR